MGPEALEVLNELQLPLAREVLATPGEIQQLTPSIDALYTPSIDEALDEEESKRAFWKSFRVLGAWYADFPPY
jgi:uracil-DNA glycosylase